MPQSARLRQEYLGLARTLLAHERAELRTNLGLGRDALKRHLRRIDEARNLTRELEGAKGIAFEEPRLVDALEQYASADHLLQPTMDLLAVVIDQAMEHAALQPAVETYTCVLPTGTVNAQARATADGVLVMVNSGLVMLVFAGTQVIAHAANLAGGARSNWLGRALYTDEQLLRAFTSVILAYLVFGDVTKAPHLAPQGGIRGQLHDSLWQSTQVFAVAHEFGHVLAGHISTGGAKRLETPGWEHIECVAKTVEQEFEADQLGARLAAGLAVGTGNPQAPSFMIAGASLFFALVGAIDRLRVEGLGVQTSPDADHPPPDVRAQALRAEFGRQFGPEHFEFADASVEWVRGATDHAVRYVVRAISTVA